MKTQIILLSLMSAFLGNSENKNTQYNNLDSGIVKNVYYNSIIKQVSLNQKEKSFNNIIAKTDTIKKNHPYNVLYSNSTLTYSIRKVANTGNSVFFTGQNGFSSLPHLSFYQNSGTYSEIGNKKGFDNITFPFKCKIISAATNFDSRFTVTSTNAINNFEIVINEPGSWEISFK